MRVEDMSRIDVESKVFWAGLPLHGVLGSLEGIKPWPKDDLLKSTLDRIEVEVRGVIEAMRSVSE